MFIIARQEPDMNNKLDDFDREIELTRQNKDLMKFLEGRAKQQESIPLDDVKRQLGLE
jgi:hypothetical protein